jgi:hypothetical protein
MAYEWDDEETRRQNRERNEATNAANPNADEGLPYHDGDIEAGGYIKGIGNTIAAGRSTTSGDADRFYNEGVSKYGREAVDSFLSRNQGDYSRIDSGLADLLEPENAGQATSQYSGGAGAGAMGSGFAAESALAELMQQLTGDRQRQQQERSSNREILMSQLGLLQQPTTANSPGIKEAIAANQLGLARGTEAGRRNSAEKRAYDGSGGVGSRAYDTDINRLLQQEGESGAQFAGNAVYRANIQRQEQLQSLLQTALALGDAESARNIQQQLSAIGQQMQNSQFYSGLGQNQSQFLDSQAYNYSALNQGANQAALMAILGMV